MKRIIIHFALSLVLISGLTGCKKNKNEQSAPTLTFEKTEYYPLETAQLKVENLTLTDSTYSGTLNGNVIQVRNYSNQLVFFVPDIAAGDYTIKILLGDKEYSVLLRVITAPVITNPDTYLQTLITQNDSTAARIDRLTDSLDAADKTAALNDLQTVNDLFDNLITQYNALSPAEKLEAAKVLAANKWWMDEIHAATSDILSDMLAYKTEADVPDYEHKVDGSMKKFVIAVAKVIQHIPKAAKWITGGALVGSVIPGLGTGIGASIGAGIAIGNIIKDIQELLAAEERLADLKYVTTDDLNSEKTNNVIWFTSLSTQQVFVRLNYRTPYQADANSTVPMVSKLVNAMASLRNCLGLIKYGLPASLRNPKIVQDIPTYKTTTRQVNSTYLSVSNISNSNVTLAKIIRTGGGLKLRFDSPNGSQLDFSFFMNYTNADFGRQSEEVFVYLQAGTPVPYDIQIGDSLCGGIVFYIDTSHEHGLVCDTIDLEYAPNDYDFTWGCYYNSIGVSDIDVGTGYNNTYWIKFLCPESRCAATKLWGTNRNGYSDWFIPSLSEMSYLHDLKMQNIGNLGDGRYWTSSETGDGSAWGVNMGMDTGYVGFFMKYYIARVRPVRAF